MGTVTASEILLLVLIANGPVHVSAENMNRAIGDETDYKIAVKYDDKLDEYIIELETE